MSLLLKFVEKIKYGWLKKLLIGILGIHDVVCAIGFFVLPFIKYSEKFLITALILWSYSAVIFCVIAFITYKNDLKSNKKAIEEYQKDKVVYTVGRFGVLLYFVSMFCLVFLARNDLVKVSLFGIIGIAILELLLFGVIITLLTQYKNNYLKMAKDTFRVLYVFFAVILFSVVMLSGIMVHGNENYPEYVSQFLVGISAIPLLLGGIYLVCKMFLSNKMLNEKSDGLPISIILFIALGIITCILLRCVITDCKMQEIMTTIFASILGGAITLAGVAWTIKDADTKRKEEERKRYVPFVNLYTDKCNKPDHTITIPHVNLPCSYKKNYYIIESCFLKNTDFSAFCVSEIIINNYLIHVQPHSYIDKKWIVKIKFNRCFILDERIEYFGIQVKDMLGNVYNIAIDFEPIYYSNGFIKIKSKGCYPAELVKPNANEKGDKQ